MLGPQGTGYAARQKVGAPSAVQGEGTKPVRNVSLRPLSQIEPACSNILALGHGSKYRAELSVGLRLANTLQIFFFRMEIVQPQPSPQCVAKLNRMAGSAPSYLSFDKVASISGP